jgi:hypothetical protein
MKPRISLVIAIATIVVFAALGSPVAVAKKPKKSAPKERTVEMPYTDPAVGTAGFGVCLQGTSCVFIDPLATEHYVSIEITDDLGLPVYASIIQDTSGDGSYFALDDQTTHICGKTDKPIEIEPQTVTVWVWRTPGASPACPGTASSGTVKATFSSAP